MKVIERSNSPSQLPGHEQAALFRVGAVIATEAIAVYIDSDRVDGTYAPPAEFDTLPLRLKLRILEACAQAFTRRREELLKDSLTAGDPWVADLVETETRTKADV